ncbi:NUDIX hydrolase [Pseudonocardiaceae bacterium YIM PH 21723]|nr:NUDIX hydrolase [Pseudonocardiaceae bacterium YIM PH 21723]
MMTPGAHEFEVVASKDRYVGPVFAVRSDEVTMPGGGTAIRDVVENHGAVVIVALDADEHVVLIHQYRHPVRRRLWELPAGLLDVPGEDPLLAAQRELAEETGLAAARWDLLIDVAASPGFSEETARVFLARELSEVDRPEVTGDEEADLEIRRVPLTEALNWVLAGEILNGASVGGILATHAVLSGTVELRPADSPWRDRPTHFPARKA